MKSMFLYLEGWEMADNYVDLYPGEAKTISCRKAGMHAASVKALKVFSIGNTSPMQMVWKKSL
jgi:hypothetical protein